MSEKIVTIPPSGIRKFFDIVSEMKDAISLGVGEPDFDTPWHIREEGIYSLEKGRTFYTANSGLRDLRVEIHNYQKRKYDVEYDPDREIMVTVGGSEAIDIALRAMLDPGDQVLVPQPSFVSYVPCAVLAGGEAVPIELEEKDEFRLTPESVYQLTPASLQELIDNPAGEDSGSVGKLLTSDTWYFAANLPQESAARLEEGDTATLRFSGELNRDVNMNVDRIGPTEGGKTLVVFSSNRYLTLTTLLRHQTVELIFESWSGLRIPKEALHLEAVPLPGDSSSSSAETVNKLVVYALINGRSEMREVEIIHEGADYYVVRPVGSGRKLLRDGDTIITAATGLQDGLLLEG